MSETYTLTVTMKVTKAQAIALTAMFKHWNRLSSIGASRQVSFFVDGDGNFHPKCEVKCNPPIDNGEKLEHLAYDTSCNPNCFDYDRIAWRLHDER